MWAALSPLRGPGPGQTAPDSRCSPWTHRLDRRNSSSAEEIITRTSDIVVLEDEIVHVASRRSEISHSRSSEAYSRCEAAARVEKLRDPLRGERRDRQTRRSARAPTVVRRDLFGEHLAYPVCGHWCLGVLNRSSSLLLAVARPSARGGAAP